MNNNVMDNTLVPTAEDAPVDNRLSVAPNAAESLAGGLAELAAEAGLAVQVPRIGTMLSLFFSDTAVHDYDAARASSSGRYRDFFHTMLARGVSLPPSAFETWFVSTAHGRDEVDHTLAAARDAFRQLPG